MDIDTFMTTVYIMVNDYCKSQQTGGRVQPGPTPSLCVSEVLTLVLPSRWNVFSSERAFYRYASRHLRRAFPNLPQYSQFNRLARFALPWLIGFSHTLVAQLQARQCAYEALDTMARAHPWPSLPEVGLPALGEYLTDNGFCGEDNHAWWERAHGARVISPPQRSRSRLPWPKTLRRWLASLRQIVETVHDRLLHSFRLEHERPHQLQGFRARLAASVALHDFCIWLNVQLGRPKLAFADLVE